MHDDGREVLATIAMAVPSLSRTYTSQKCDKCTSSLLSSDTWWDDRPATHWINSEMQQKVVKGALSLLPDTKCRGCIVVARRSAKVLMILLDQLGVAWANRLGV